MYSFPGTSVQLLCPSVKDLSITTGNQKCVLKLITNVLDPMPSNVAVYNHWTGLDWTTGLPVELKVQRYTSILVLT